MAIDETVIERTQDVEAALQQVTRHVSILVERGSRRLTLRFRL